MNGQQNYAKYTKINERCMMTKKREESFVESDNERENGHVDTREANFECANKDEHLGCDPGIDVAG
jgi:hypothetical protein